MCICYLLCLLLVSLSSSETLVLIRILFVFPLCNLSNFSILFKPSIISLRLLFSIFFCNTPISFLLYLFYISFLQLSLKNLSGLFISAMQMKKIALKLDLHDGKAKQKALKTVSTLSGIDSIAMDMKAKQLTVIGTVDPVNVVRKLRKHWPTDMVSVGPAKEPEKEEPKKEEPKKEEEQKKEEPKKEEEQKKEESKEEAKKEEPKKEEEKKKPQPPPDPDLELVKTYKAYNPHMTTYYYVQSMEENPNACVIC